MHFVLASGTKQGRGRSFVLSSVSLLMRPRWLQLPGASEITIAAHHSLSSEAANASTAGYFDTLDKKLFRENRVQKNILSSACLHHSFHPLSLQRFCISCSGSGLQVLVSVTQEKDISLGALHASGRGKRRHTWLRLLGQDRPDRQPAGNHCSVNGLSGSRR